MIKAIKFDGLTELIPIQVNLLNGLLKTFNLPPAWHGTPREKWLLTAVPLFAKRQRQRNFNQAELLAINLAKATGLNYLPTLLRTGKRRAQSELKDKQTRHANVQGVFSALPQANIAGQTFILVDDVYTSGATMQECAKVLKAAGAQAVWGLTVAKG
jgi:ComF family protein